MSLHRGIGKIHFNAQHLKRNSLITGFLAVIIYLAVTLPVLQTWLAVAIGMCSVVILIIAIDTFLPIETTWHNYEEIELHYPETCCQPNQSLNPWEDFDE